MSFQIENEIVRLNNEIRHKKIKLRRLENKRFPLIWDQISIRLLRLEVIVLKEQLQKAINEQLNPNPNSN